MNKKTFLSLLIPAALLCSTTGSAIEVRQDIGVGAENKIKKPFKALTGAKSIAFAYQGSNITNDAAWDSRDQLQAAILKLVRNEAPLNKPILDALRDFNSSPVLRVHWTPDFLADFAEAAARDPKRAQEIKDALKGLGNALTIPPKGEPAEESVEIAVRNTSIAVRNTSISAQGTDEEHALKSLTYLTLDDVNGLTLVQCEEYVKQFNAEYFRCNLEPRDLIAFCEANGISTKFGDRITREFDKWWQTYAHRQYDDATDRELLDSRLQRDWQSKYKEELPLEGLSPLQRKFRLLCLEETLLCSTFWGVQLGEHRANFCDINWLRANRRYFAQAEGVNNLSKVVLAIVKKL